MKNLLFSFTLLLLMLLLWKIWTTSHGIPINKLLQMIIRRILLAMDILLLCGCGWRVIVVYNNVDVPPDNNNNVLLVVIKHKLTNALYTITDFFSSKSKLKNYGMACQWCQTNFIHLNISYSTKLGILLIIVIIVGAIGIYYYLHFYWCNVKTQIT